MIGRLVSSDDQARRRALVSWSSGKDSAWALHKGLQRGDLEVVGLLTTFNAEFDRVSMQGVRRDLVDMQAARLGLPVWSMELTVLSQGVHSGGEVFKQLSVEGPASKGPVKLTRIKGGDHRPEPIFEHLLSK